MTETAVEQREADLAHEDPADAPQFETSPPLRAAGAVLDGTFAAATAVLLAYAVAAFPVLVDLCARSARADADGPSAALSTVTRVLMAAHRAGLGMVPADPTAPQDAVPLLLVPLGITLPVLWLLARAGASAVRDALHPDGDADPRYALLALLALTGVYSGLCALLAILADGPANPVDRGQAAAGAAVAAALAGTVGAVRAGALHRLPGIFPARGEAPARTVGQVLTGGARTGTVAAAGLGLGGVLAVVVLLTVHGGRTADLTRAVAPAAGDAVGLWLLCLALLPNAAVCAIAFSVGSGFTLGPGTVVDRTGVTLGPLPDLPLLAALPADPGPVPSAAYALALIPLAAGTAAGLHAARSGGVLRSAGTAAAGSALAGLCVWAAAWLADGAAGQQALASLGPDPAGTGLGVTAALTAVSVPVAAVCAWWRGRPPKVSATAVTVVLAPDMPGTENGPAPKSGPVPETA